MAYDHCYSWGILLMFRAQDQIYLSDIKCSLEDPGRAWIPKFLSALVVLHPRMSSSNDQLLECVHYPHPVVWLWDSEALENSWNIIVFSTRFWWIRCLDLTDNLRVVLKTSKKQEKKKKRKKDGEIRPGISWFRLYPAFLGPPLWKQKQKDITCPG